MINMVTPLHDVLAYKNPQVILRYQQDYPNNKMSAKEAWLEVLRYLWLCYNHHLDCKNSPDDISLNFTCDIHTEMKDIDDMWHVFLLFTQDYQEFCQHYFGYFIHHRPNNGERSVDPITFTKETSYYLSYIYDHLGEATVIKWFNESLNDSELVS